MESRFGGNGTGSHGEYGAHPQIALHPVTGEITYITATIPYWQESQPERHPVIQEFFCLAGEIAESAGNHARRRVCLAPRECDAWTMRVVASARCSCSAVMAARSRPSTIHQSRSTSIRRIGRCCPMSCCCQCAGSSDYAILSMVEPNAAELFAAHVTSVRLEDIPHAAIERAKVFILDSLGVGIAGATATGRDEILAAARRWGAGEETSLVS